MVDGRDSAWRNRAPGPHAHRNTARLATDGLWTEARGQQKQSNDPGNNQHILNMPTTGLRERRNDTSKSTGRSGRQNAVTRRNMQREERVTVQGPVKEQQPDGMSHRGCSSVGARVWKVFPGGHKWRPAPVASAGLPVLTCSAFSHSQTL